MTTEPWYLVYERDVLGVKLKRRRPPPPDVHHPAVATQPAEPEPSRSWASVIADIRGRWQR